MTKTARVKPTVFVATSAAGTSLSYAIQKQLQNDAEIVLWSEGLSLGRPIFESLRETLSSSDFAIIGFTHDDLAVTRSHSHAGRNLLFETGLYVGVLGLERTFFLLPPKASMALPSDLSGVRYLQYNPSKDLLHAVARACAYIRVQIHALKFRDGREEASTKIVRKKKRVARSTTRISKKAKRRSRSTPNQKQVFISYSHKDKRWLEKLRTLLVPSVESETIFLWDDSMIKPGDDWEARIEAALHSAKVAILLVSPDFLASRFISKVELPPLLDGAKKKGIRILWVYLRACDYKRTAIARYQATHDVSRPLKALSGARQDQELLNIVEKINDATK